MKNSPGERLGKRMNVREAVSIQREGNHWAVGTCKGKAFGPRSGSRCRGVGFIKLKEWQCNTLN